jgi:hypothetical protein
LVDGKLRDDFWLEPEAKTVTDGEIDIKGEVLTDK